MLKANGHGNYVYYKDRLVRRFDGFDSTTINAAGEIQIKSSSAITGNACQSHGRKTVTVSRYSEDGSLLGADNNEITGISQLCLNKG